MDNQQALDQLLKNTQKPNALKKVLTVLSMILPTTIYVAIFHVIVPSVSVVTMYDESYDIKGADSILNITADALTATNFYAVGSNNWRMEIIGVDNGVFTFSGDSVEVTSKQTSATFTTNSIVLSGKNILITIHNVSEYTGAIPNHEIVDSNVGIFADKINISIGVILGIVVVMLFVLSKAKEYNKDIARLLGLVVITVIVLLLQSIFADMLWVLLTADVGLLGSIFIDKLAPDDLGGKSYRERQKRKKAHKLAIANADANNSGNV